MGKINLIPGLEPYIKRLNSYAQEHYPAYKKITAEEWNALFIALVHQGNTQEETFEKIINGILPTSIETINALIKQSEKYVQDLTDLESKIPTDTAQLDNGAGFITKAVNDLVNYYTKNETYTQEQINQKISAIPKFAVSVVSDLPTQNISETTIYLLKDKGSTDKQNLYTEYIYNNGAWEQLGTQTLLLNNYYDKSEVDKKLSYKQDLLISNSNIKTVNGESLLGKGNIFIPEGPIGPTGPQGVGVLGALVTELN